MASQRLETLITINAKTGPGFSDVGNTLTELGTLVDGLSSQLIDFGKDSVNVYRDYQKSMKDAEVALSTTYGRGTRELNQVMDQLDASATQWAASTIFHTNDVANAISEAAHAGWDYEQILAGIPAAMELAQAGGMDLSESVNYIVKSTNAAGVEFEDMADFIDLWTFAANSSASDIEEFGEAMLRMGSTMRFAENTEELMTLLAVTANAGSVGGEAGTMIRNSMMRLIAPTKKAKEVMEELGATSDETAALMEDQALAAANARLEANGFSAFDEDGNLKSTLDIYRELYLALGDIAGGFENIDQNKFALEALAAIFPTRTITEALTLLRGAADGYDGLYDAMIGGAASGYGTYASETMMNTLDGSIETFGSKVERLKQLTGEELSGQVISVAEGLGNIVDSIAELDEGTFGALVHGLEVVAIAGPGLTAAGTAFRLIGHLLTPTGAIGVGLVTLGALAAYAMEIKEAHFEDGFGLANMDHEAINRSLSEIASGFESTYTQVNNFRTALDESVTSYQSASQTLTGTLLTDVITGNQLSEKDISDLQSIGDQMHKALIDGITTSTASSLSYFELLFGDDSSSSYGNIKDITGTAYDAAIANAESIGQSLRNAMTSAFADGTISESEYQDILSYVQSYNDAMTRASNEAKSEQDYIEQQMLMHRMQSASYDEMQAITGEIIERRDSLLSEAEDTYLRERYGLEYRYNQAIQNGGMINGRRATAIMRDRDLEAMDQKYNEHAATLSSQYDALLLRAYTPILDSDYGESYKMIMDAAKEVREGQRSIEDAAYYTDWTSDAYSVQRLLDEQIGVFGGADSLISKALEYSNIGNIDLASQLYDLYNASMINTGVVENRDGYSQLAEEIQGLADEPLEITVEGNTEDLSGKIEEQDNREIITIVTGDTSALSAAINSMNGRTVTVGISTGGGGGAVRFARYAEGGRADIASIFGEDGPEWAIPEEHTERTASLLNAAREASGFTWPDLLERFGGLNSNANNVPSTLVYSPVIHANDAAGVDKALIADKDRLNRWYEDKKRMDGWEVYA